MLYLLDAKTLIDAEAFYYGFDQVPQFWTWLQTKCEAGHVKMPWQEIQGARGALGTWVNDAVVKSDLVLDEQTDRMTLQAVMEQAYTPDLTDAELEQVGGDPFPTAYAVLSAAERVVVTKEVSKPSRQRHNRKLPGARTIMGVQWITDFALYRILGFRAV